MALSDSAKETIEYMFTLTPKPGKAAMYGCQDIQKYMKKLLVVS